MLDGSVFPLTVFRTGKGFSGVRVLHSPNPRSTTLYKQTPGEWFDSTTEGCQKLIWITYTPGQPKVIVVDSINEARQGLIFTSCLLCANIKADDVRYID